MDNFKELAEVLLPEGILKHFYFVKVEKEIENEKEIITIHLEEKEDLPEIPLEHKGKRISSKGFKKVSVEDFPVRGRKVRLKIKRRVWKIEGVEKWVKKDIAIKYPNTKLEKEFGFF
jgi:hypothetical protein